MGCGASKSEIEQAAKTEEIDTQLEKDRITQANTVKLLLLGAGESGKSTIAKQLKIIHDHGFNVEECNNFKEVIFDNVMTAMTVLVRRMKTWGVEPADPNLAGIFEEFLNLPEGRNAENFNKKMADGIKALWADKNLQSVYARRNEYQLSDASSYYFENISRLADPAYVPTEADIVHSRVKTTGIVETTFVYKNVVFKMFDVGGQRSERKKWIHCFENVTAIIFCVAISAYDQVLLEDEETNRMHESMVLFESICNSKWFVNTSMILFLNKTDLFKEKIGDSPLTIAFPDYAGTSDYEVATAFIRDKFEGLNKNQDTKTVYSHLTCATDTENVKFVFAAVTDIIIRESLRDCGLI